jgi:hypothetical protein
MDSQSTALQIIEPARSEIPVTLRGLRKDAGSLTPRNVRVRPGFREAPAGPQSLRIFQNLITLMLGLISLLIKPYLSLRTRLKKRVPIPVPDPPLTLAAGGGLCFLRVGFGLPVYSHLPGG